MGAKKERFRRAIQRFDFATRSIAGKFTHLDSEKNEHLRAFFLKRWLNEAEHASPARTAALKAYWHSERGRHDLEGHVVGRLEHDRREYIPWLNSIVPLDGARVLEIGCGTGSSAMALTEQGARVTGIDVVDEAIDMTKERIRIFGLDNARALKMNATDLDTRFRKGEFDLILFFASLEHMTLPERLKSLTAAWELLETSAVLCVVEAPNRLWYHDDHTSNLPFFQWLPDQIAIEYWKRSSNYNNDPIYDAATEETWCAFARLGRGVSFHEFELAIGPITDLSVPVDRASFQFGQNPLRRLHYAVSMKRRYVEILRRQRPDIPIGFFMPYLNIAVRKSDHARLS
jgi:2-polyprenyl-3-methyl-5-hydroxy-6-metoxy-1,4-benzoquinol methylase